MSVDWRSSSTCSSQWMGDVLCPCWWAYPTQCQHRHQWLPRAGMGCRSHARPVTSGTGDTRVGPGGGFRGGVGRRPSFVGAGGRGLAGWVLSKHDQLRQLTAGLVGLAVARPPSWVPGGSRVRGGPDVCGCCRLPPCWRWLLESAGLRELSSRAGYLRGVAVSSCGGAAPHGGQRSCPLDDQAPGGHDLFGSAIRPYVVAIHHDQEAAGGSRR